MRLIDDPAAGRDALAAAQAANLARMRDAVLRSETCAAVRPYAEALHPDRLTEAPLMTREQLAGWGSRPDAPHRITTGDTRLVLRSSGSSGRVRTLLHDRAFNDQVEALGARGLCWDGLGDNPFVINALVTIPGIDCFRGPCSRLRTMSLRSGRCVRPTRHCSPFIAAWSWSGCQGWLGR